MQDTLAMHKIFFEFDMNCKGGMHSWISFQESPWILALSLFQKYLPRQKIRDIMKGTFQTFNRDL